VRGSPFLTLHFELPRQQGDTLVPQRLDSFHHTLSDVYVFCCDLVIGLPKTSPIYELSLL